MSSFCVIRSWVTSDGGHDAGRGSPADRQSIEPGDLIVSMGRYYIDDVDHVGRLLEGFRLNDSIRIGLLRYERGTLYEVYRRMYAR